MKSKIKNREFAEQLKNCLNEMLGEEYEVQINHVIKNNGIELEGISLRREQERSMPMIYAEDYRELYENGTSVEEIAQMVWKRYQNAKNAEESFERLEELSLQTMRNKIIFRLVNFEKNEAALKKQPYIRYLDLAITFQCLVRQGKSDIGTVRITNDLMQYWGISQDEIYQEAKKNTPRLFPVSIRTMDEVILDIMEKEMREVYTVEEKKEILAGAREQMKSEDMFLMYILSNQSGVNGAAALLYEEDLKEFANREEKDFFILPSSIHEGATRFAA